MKYFIIILSILTTFVIADRIYNEKMMLRDHANMEAKHWGAYRNYSSMDSHRRPARSYFYQMEPANHPYDRQYHMKIHGDR